jgi:hypothetical protein
MGIAFPAFAADAKAQSRDASSGLHGMVLFGGKDGLYASHMPMFHAPHDTQVVIAIHIDNPKVEATMRHELSAHPTMWSIVPEQFELDRLASGSDHPLQAFHADLVKGHFERGGRTRFRQVSVHVDAVLLYRSLNPQPGITKSGNYFVIAKEGSRDGFLIKLIEARPDVDQIIAITRPKMEQLPNTMSLPLQDELTLPASTLVTQLHERCDCEVALGVELYRETDDLK